VKIVRDASIEQWIHTETCNNWGKGEREGIHLSDLLAPRKAFFQRVDPKHPTFEEICYWMSGNAVEDKFLRSIGYEHGEQREWNGILYTPDMFLGFIAELKSRRGGLAKEGGEAADTYDYYLKQLQGYCAIVDSTQGWLLVLSLVEKQADFTTKPELAAYRVEFTKEELYDTAAELLHLRDKLISAIEYKDYVNVYLTLPECPSWMCGKKTYEVIEKPFCVDCNKEFASENNIKKHQKSKGHSVKSGEYKEIYEVRCKWFYSCIGRGKSPLSGQNKGGLNVTE